MATDHDTVTQLADVFVARCPSPEHMVSPPGYRDAGVALVDAVFTISAHYSGTAAVVGRYAAAAGIATPALPPDPAAADHHDLDALLAVLAGRPAQQLADEVFASDAKSPSVGRLKAELVGEAAAGLVAVGARRRHDVADADADAVAAQRRAWTRPDGLASVSFDYFRVLCGVEATKPDVMVRRWLASVLGPTPGVRAARALVAALTGELARRWQTDVSQRAVDHTIWRVASGRSLAR